jgi:uncharacterized protein YkwD
MARRLLVFVLVLVPLLIAPSVASAATAPERRAFELVNATRERHGRHDVAMRARLMRYAEHHARVMARKNRLFHSPLSLDGFAALGECVGYGGSVFEVHRSFLRSPEHRSIILGRWKWVGIGVASRNGTRYVTEVFAR